MPQTGPAQPPLLSLTALERSLSKQRLDAYADKSDRDDRDRVARYLWNMALASSFLPSLHVFEVTLRNALFNASLKHVDESVLTMPDVPCWLDAKPSLLYANEREDVERAKSYLGTSRKGRTTGHLIAKLSMGFWVQLTSRVYSDLRPHGPRLWPRGLPDAFPFRWASGAKRNAPGHDDREMLYGRLHEIRELRNRVAHHEPIWDRELELRYTRMIEVLGWMSRKTAEAVVALDSFPTILRAGPSAFRDRAERLLGKAEQERAEPNGS